MFHCLFAKRKLSRIKGAEFKTWREEEPSLWSVWLSSPPLCSSRLPLRHSGSRLCSAAGGAHHHHAEASQSVPPSVLHQVTDVNAQEVTAAPPVAVSAAVMMVSVSPAVIRRSCCQNQMSTPPWSPWPSPRAPNWTKSEGRAWIHPGSLRVGVCFKRCSPSELILKMFFLWFGPVKGGGCVWSQEERVDSVLRWISHRVICVRRANKLFKTPVRLLFSFWNRYNVLIRELSLWPARLAVSPSLC